jgi:peptide/nickel transport system permease protein
MNTYHYVLRRLLYVVPILIGVSLLIFVLFNIVSGDPTAVLLGKYATPKQMAELKHELGLDKSMFLQYIDILKSVFTFDFGRSWKSKQLISNMISQGALNSLTVTIPTFILVNVIAVIISFGLAFVRGSFLDKAAVFGCVIMMSISALAYILFCQWMLAYKLGIFEICGYESGFPHFIPYIILPVIIGIFLELGHDVRYYRTVVLDEIHQEYVRTAKAKGLAIKIVLFKHVLKNAMIPIVTNTVLQVPNLIMGGILIESFFSIPGFGNIVMQAIYNSDFPVIKATTIVMSVLCILFNVIADVVYNFLDPRIRLK